jgi:hypothetical protein
LKRVRTKEQGLGRVPVRKQLKDIDNGNLLIHIDTGAQDLKEDGETSQVDNSRTTLLELFIDTSVSCVSQREGSPQSSPTSNELGHTTTVVDNVLLAVQGADDAHELTVGCHVLQVEGCERVFGMHRQVPLSS